MQKSIEVTGLSKLYGNQKALDNISLDVFAGEVIGLLGPNGAGKSTLMKIISCFIPPTGGDVKVMGHSIFDNTLAIRQKIGYLPENNPLYLEMYVKEFLGFIAGIHKLPNSQARIREIISLTGLAKEQHKRIAALSKGYRQRVGLAQALIHNPEVLILDEPTSGLDPNQLVEIRSLISEIGQSRTVLLSTHIMQEVEAVCGRVVIIDKGKIVADDTTARLSSMMAGESLLEVELSAQLEPDTFFAIKGLINVELSAPSTYLLTSDAAIDIREDVFNLAVAEGVKVLSQRKIERRLEDVFQSLTSHA